MRLLVVVAHPDDESFGCGSLLAHAHAIGYETAVLCATRGEAGGSRIASDDLGALREAELRSAASILGVGTVRLLDYRDSGMTGEAGPGSLAAAGPSTVAAQVRAIIDDLRPDVVVTLDASDGHRDHVAIRDATIGAVDEAEHQASSVYLECLARSSMARWAEHARGAMGAAYSELGELGTPDEEITTVLEVHPSAETLGGDPGSREPGEPLRRSPT